MATGIASVVATINGASYNLVLNEETGLYEATLVAPMLSSFPQLDHKYGITLVATDAAGNATTIDRYDTEFGDELTIRVKEIVPPIIEATFPTEGASVLQSQPTLQWNVSDNDSGIDWTTLLVKVNGTVITDEVAHSAVSGHWECSVDLTTALNDGANTVEYQVIDNDGNAATPVLVNFTVDTVAPSLSVSAPQDGLLTNVAEQLCTGVAADLTSPPVEVKITVNGVDQGFVEVDGEDNFTKQILLSAFSNVVVITATDQAGRVTTITRSVTLDQAPPVFVSVDVAPDMMDAGRTYVVRARVTDA